VRQSSGALGRRVACAEWGGTFYFLDDEPFGDTLRSPIRRWQFHSIACGIYDRWRDKY